MKPELVVSCSVCGHQYGVYAHRDDMPDFEEEIACPCLQDALVDLLTDLRTLKVTAWRRA